MPSSPIKLCMIPGASTDRRMYAPQLDQFPDMIIPQWLPPLGKKESLENYARRLADTIDVPNPFILGGVSLGGMIAQQMALQLKPAAVILIATSSTSSALSLWARLSGKIMRWLPNFAVKWLLACMSLLVGFNKSLRHHELYSQMLKELPPELVRWQSGAATQWQLKEPLSMPVFHIHGAKDPIIPVKNVRPDAVISEGGHLISATHAEQVNRLLGDYMQRYAPGQSYSSAQSYSSNQSYSSDQSYSSGQYTPGEIKMRSNSGK